MQPNLRPLERRLLRLRAQGLTTPQIAVRFKRSPDHINRVFRLIEVKQGKP